MKGKEAEIAELYERYYARLMVIACSYTGNRDEAEDLVQEAFVKAILSYRAGGSFLCWAARVMRNSYLNSRRREKFLGGDIGALSLAATQDLLSDYVDGEERARLAAMIAALPEKYKSVMIESVYLGENNAAIARTHGISEENVRQIKSRAKRMLLKMKEEEDEKDR